MDAVAPPWLKGTDHLLSRWQAMLDLLARVSAMPYAMINRVDGEDLIVHAINQGAEGMKVDDHFELCANTYCARALRSGKTLHVEDARLLPEMDDNPTALFGLVSYYGLPIRAADGSLFGTLCILDAKPRVPDDPSRQLIALLRDSMEQDLALVQANEVAQAARLAAEAANRAKTDFLARASHELRTPLGGVLGFAQLLEMDPVSPLSLRQAERVAHIHQSGNHLLALLDDMLDVSRVEAGEMRLQLAPLDIPALMAASLTMQQSQADEAGVTLHPQDCGPGVSVMADINRLRQVLLNLLSNAIKYNRRGGQVWLRAELANGQVRIEVRDDGLGMTPEQMSHLFEPFNRLGREGSTIRGTGLGLSLSQQLVRLMGGTIGVDSVAGQGTTVHLCWPALAGPGPGAGAGAG